MGDRLRHARTSVCQNARVLTSLYQNLCETGCSPLTYLSRPQDARLAMIVADALDWRGYKRQKFFDSKYHIPMHATTKLSLGLFNGIYKEGSSSTLSKLHLPPCSWLEICALPLYDWLMVAQASQGTAPHLATPAANTSQPPQSSIVQASVSVKCAKCGSVMPPGETCQYDWCPKNMTD